MHLQSVIHSQKLFSKWLLSNVGHALWMVSASPEHPDADRRIMWCWPKFLGKQWLHEKHIKDIASHSMCAVCGPELPMVCASFKPSFGFKKQLSVGVYWTETLSVCFVADLIACIIAVSLFRVCFVPNVVIWNWVKSLSELRYFVWVMA